MNKTRENNLVLELASTIVRQGELLYDNSLLLNQQTVYTHEIMRLDSIPFLVAGVGGIVTPRRVVQEISKMLRKFVRGRGRSWATRLSNIPQKKLLTKFINAWHKLTKEQKEEFAEKYVLRLMQRGDLSITKASYRPERIQQTVHTFFSKHYRLWLDKLLLTDYMDHE